MRELMEINPGDIFEGLRGTYMVIKVRNGLAYMACGEMIGVTVLDTAQFEYKGNILN
jgi:hypothetical protein